VALAILRAVPEPLDLGLVLTDPLQPLREGRSKCGHNVPANLDERPRELASRWRLSLVAIFEHLSMVFSAPA
jgi:hypothetical protein